MTQRTTFSTEAYERLLDAISAGGYRYSSFTDDRGDDGVIFLRHDIDKSVFDALTIARLEAARAVHATYFFLLRSPLYSLLEPEAWECVAEIASLGHDIGLHCDIRRVPRSAGGIDATVEREIAVLESVLGMPTCGAVSFHNPPREVIGRTPSSEAYVSAYEPRFMLPHTKYISDSNALWREGDPCGSLASRTWTRVQVLVHPFWWTGVPCTTTDRLAGVLGRRAAELDTYLRYSNDLWREHCLGSTGDRG